MGEVQIALTTCPSRETAEELARRCVEERLAGCVNIVPGLTSIFHWKEQLCEESEVLLILKTLPTKLVALEHRLHEIHPYDTPEFVVLDARHVSARYNEWLRGVLGDGS